MNGNRWIALGAALALAACGTPPRIPDFTYFRLPAPAPVMPLPAPLFTDAVVVEAFAADGLYSDKALIYALDSTAQQLRQYHYQLWTDPPTRILQRRLIARLRSAQLAPRITDEMPASAAALRIRGIILRFDRVPAADGGFDAVVALKLRASSVDGEPIVDQLYQAHQHASAAGLAATVDAFGAAVDEIFAKFQADLDHRRGVADAR